MSVSRSGREPAFFDGAGQFGWGCGRHVEFLRSRWDEKSVASSGGSPYATFNEPAPNHTPTTRFLRLESQMGGELYVSS